MTSRPLPEGVLAGVTPWREARTVRSRPLPGGLSNETWRVNVDGEDYVLRLASLPLPPPVANPRRELKVHRAASTAGLAPELIHADPDAGVLVTRYADGAVLSVDEVRKPGVLAGIADLLQRVRKLPDPGGHYTLAEAGAAYLMTVTDRELRDRGGALVRELQLLPAPVEPGVCHMDPVAGNLLQGDGTMMLIDWEFSVLGDPLFDVAAVAAYHDLEAGEVDLLLRAWAGGDQPRLRRRLDRLMRAHDVLHWLWLAARGELEPAARERLERRLSRPPQAAH